MNGYWKIYDSNFIKTHKIINILFRMTIYPNRDPIPILLLDIE